jgi:hypothetical protein
MFQSVDDNAGVVKNFTSQELQHQNSMVVAMDVLEKDRHVVVVQQDGTLSIYSEDLSEILLQTHLTPADRRGPFNVLAVRHLSSVDANKTILKQRPDLLRSRSSETSYLAAVYSIIGDDEGLLPTFFYAVWPVDLANVSLSSAILEPLLQHELALDNNAIKQATSKNQGFEFSPSATHLYVNLGDTHVTLELSGLRPVQTSLLSLGHSDHHEFMAISPAFAVCAFQDAIRMYDLKYQTSQAHIELKGSTLKRKRGGAAPDAQSGTIKLLGFYPQLSRIIANRRNQLLALDITTVGPRKTLETGTKLVSNIGQSTGSRKYTFNPDTGLQSLAIGTVGVPINMPTPENWQATVERLDNLAQAANVPDLEAVFAEDIQKHLPGQNLPQKTLGELTGVVSTEIPLYKLNYILSKLFQHQPTSSGSEDDSSISVATLRVSLPAFGLIIWLSSTGLLTSQNVQMAIASGASQTVKGLGPGAVADALLAADPSCTLLLRCIENGFSPYLAEQAAIVRTLIQQALQFSSSGAEPESRHDHEPTNGLAENKMPIQRRTQKNSSPSAWLPDLVKQALITALNRFGLATTSVISTYLKTQFSQTEVLALIQFLRQQLFQGGHTLSFDTHPETALSEAHQEPVVGLDSIVRILSSCVDVIGPLGFFGALDNEDFIDNIVPDLVSELARTKQSLEDAAALQCVLRETLRYQESVQSLREMGGRFVNQKEMAGVEQKPGTIVTIHSETRDGQGLTNNRDILPLSLRAENVINPFKVRKGGGQVSRRSFRQLSMLVKRQKGPYSFERLVL